jgi:hypothetical protein
MPSGVILPAFPENLRNQKGFRTEWEFYEACEAQLVPSGWTILWRIQWFGKRRGKILPGESDFILMHPEFGVFVAEVKGGQEIGTARFRRSDGKEVHGWYTISHGETHKKEIRNPVQQALDGKFFLEDYLKKSDSVFRRKSRPFGHFAVLPSVLKPRPSEPQMAPDAPNELICDKKDLKNLTRFLKGVRRVLSNPPWLSSEMIQRATDLLLTQISLITPGFDQLDFVDDALSLLTEEQLVAFNALRNFRRLTIVGRAGTGKTVLAFHRAKEISTSGLKTLYLCSSEALAIQLQNEPLSSRIREHLAILSVSKFHEMIWADWESKVDPSLKTQIVADRTRFGRLDNEGWTYPADIRPTWEYVEEYANRRLREGHGFDAVIFDEAQSYGQSTFLSALSLLNNAESALLYIFGDPFQDRYFDPDNPEGSSPSLLQSYGSDQYVELTINCRSTLEVSNFADGLFGFRTDCKGVSGPAVELVQGHPKIWPDLIHQKCTEWVSRFGLKLDEIKILSDDVRTYEHLVREAMNDAATDLMEGFTLRNDFVVDWISSNPLLTPMKQIKEILSDDVARSLLIKRSYSDDRRMELLAHQVIWDKIGEDVFSQIRAEHNAKLEALGLPVISVQPIKTFEGLEAKAVVVLAPIDPRNWDEFSRTLYTMSTRARVLLAVVATDEQASDLQSLSVWPGEVHQPSTRY